MPPKKTPPKDAAAEGKSSAEKDATPTLEQQLKDAMRDAQLKLLQEQRGKPDTDADATASQLDALLKENPAHLPILQEQLKQAVSKNSKDGKSTAEVSCPLLAHKFHAESSEGSYSVWKP